MVLRIAFAALFVFFSSNLTFAQDDVFKPNYSGKKIAGVPVFPGGILNLETKVPVTLLGVGVRQIEAGDRRNKTNVTQLFGSEPKQFVRTEAGALNSIVAMKAAAIRISPIAVAPAISSYTLYLRAIKKAKTPKSEALQKYLDAVINAGDISPGQSFMIISFHSSAGEEIFYLDQHGKNNKIVGGPGFIRMIFSFWLGEPADNGLVELKKDLLKRPEFK